ncbi:hypothetical protein KAU37_08520 [Candidatus Bipolaricaulota bacterium]|nr:hypothetical protein [Candidatus Bipolaricaulota bacterium]
MAVRPIESTGALRVEFAKEVFHYGGEQYVVVRYRRAGRIGTAFAAIYRPKGARFTAYIADSSSFTRISDRTSSEGCDTTVCRCRK